VPGAVWLCTTEQTRSRKGVTLNPEENHVNVLTALKDVAGVLLLVFLLPVWMALGFVAVAAVVTRQLYWWARGNTTVLSRVAAHASAP